MYFLCNNAITLLFLDVYEIESKLTNNSNSKEISDYEFNIWTKHDCHGTQFQNNNRTWFYFGVRSNCPSVSVRFNIVNLNKQVKMFSQGMCPVFKIVPGHLHWERIRERPTYTVIILYIIIGMRISKNIARS